MAQGYKFIRTKENLEKIKKHGFKENEELLLVKGKKVPYESKIVEISKAFYKNQDYINMMINFLKVDFSKHGLTYTEIVDPNGEKAYILEENNEFKKEIVKFELFVDPEDSDILSLSGKSELYPVTFQSKEILDEVFKIEINKLKREGLIEDIEFEEETGE